MPTTGGTGSAALDAGAETRTSEPSQAAEQPRPDPTIAPRTRDIERYEILGEHGRGGIGCVFRAHDRELGREVAIKKLLSRGNVGEMRFLREALITARLEHPGIVPVHEAGRWSDGTPFYAMKLIAGRPLRELIAERRTVGERLALVHHVIAVADAIAYAHDRKIIHRDLKPSNVIVGDFGETVVIDWGLAKDLTVNDELGGGGGPSPASRDYDLTTAGSVLGTPAYMAPEQQRGEAVDQRADVFAIGMMLWELCSLQLVPPGEPAQRRRVLRRARIDDDLVAIVDKAIAVEPNDRYRDAGALAADLRAFKSGARIAARTYSLFALLAHWIRRHRMLATAALAFVALAGVLCGALVRAWMAERLTDISITQAEVEEGRQALLHDDAEEAEIHLALAYHRGERSPEVAFMLARARQPRLAERACLVSASGRMWSAVFSPDGRRVVTGDQTCAQIWDADSGQVVFTLPHGSEVRDAQYSADGARIFTASSGSVRMWNAANGALERTLIPPPSSGAPPDYYLLALSPDGTRVAAIDVEGAVTHVWDTRTGAVVAQSRDDGTGFAAIAFSRDGRWLATIGGHVRVFDATTWSQVMMLADPHVRSIALDPAGTRLVTGTVDGDAAIWAVPSGERLRHLRELGDPVDAVAFSPDGRMVATATREGAVQVWDASSGALVSHDNHLRSKVLSLEFDRDSTRVVAAGANGKVLVADAVLGMPLAMLEGPSNVVLSAHFDRSARRIVGASWDGTARIWDAASTYLRWRSPRLGEFCGIVTSLEPDRRFVAVGCWGRPTRIWDTAQDRLLTELPGVTRVDTAFTTFPAVSAAGERAALPRGTTAEIYALPGGRPLRSIAHGAEVHAVGFASTGTDVVSGAADGSVFVTRDGRAPIALPAFTAGVDAAGFLGDGRPVAAAGGRLRVYDAARAAIVTELAVPFRVGTLRSSPDGRRLIAVPRSLDAPAPAMLWDVERGRVIASLVGHIGTVRSARFVRDGREIVTSGADGTARLWDAATGRLLHTYRGSARFLADATLDPDGRMIVAAGGDGLIRFWDAANERPLWTLFAHQPHAIALHFEGGDLVTRGFDGDVARWTLPRPDQVLDALPDVVRTPP